jgi:4'-phosphopantetheinyl transferase
MTGGCAVFWAETRDVARAAEFRLSAVERRRATGFRYEADRRQFVAGALLLRIAVARATGRQASDVVIARSCLHCGSAAHGRPTVVRPGGRHVSLTHSGDLVGVAVSTAGPVGIDLEHVTDLDVAALTTSTLAPGDRVPATTTQFLELWTAKEAALKALGLGLAYPAGKLAIQRVDGERVALRLGDQRLAAQLTTLQPPRSNCVARLTVLTAGPVNVEEQFVSLAPKRNEERCPHGRSTRRRGALFPSGRRRDRGALAAASVHDVLPERNRA